MKSIISLITLAAVAAAQPQLGFPFRGAFNNFAAVGGRFAHQPSPYFNQQFNGFNQQYNGFNQFSGLNQFSGFNGLRTPGFPFVNAVAQPQQFQPIQQQQRRLFTRDAESEAESFYPGYPYVAPFHYGQQQQQTPYMPYHHQQQTPYMPYHQQQQTVAPFMRTAAPAMYNYNGMYNAGMSPLAYRSPVHPFYYNPLLQQRMFAEAQTTKSVVEEEEHKVEKREAESFYPGYPFATGMQHHYQQQQQTPFMPYHMQPYQHHQQQQVVAPFRHHQAPYHHMGYNGHHFNSFANVMPRVLPYSFNPYTTFAATTTPVVKAEEMKTVKAVDME